VDTLHTPAEPRFYWTPGHSVHCVRDWGCWVRWCKDPQDVEFTCQGDGSPDTVVFREWSRDRTLSSSWRFDAPLVWAMYRGWHCWNCYRLLWSRLLALDAVTGWFKVSVCRYFSRLLSSDGEGSLIDMSCGWRHIVFPWRKLMPKTYWDRDSAGSLIWESQISG